MPSLKEVKTRIASVSSTRKITSAMKMVASSKLHRAQQAIGSTLPYAQGLSRIMAAFLSSSEGTLSSPFATEREVKSAALVVLTSNSSLCGAFNANAIRAALSRLHSLQGEGVAVKHVYAIGRKGEDALRRALPSGAELHVHSALLDHTRYDAVVPLAEELMQRFTSGEVDQVTIVYHHFLSTASQQVRQAQFLPVKQELDEKAAHEATSATPTEEDGYELDYIFEPTPAELYAQLVPRTLHLRLFTALLDSIASEHAARVVAMQVATDNADELLRQLQLTYNKTRQQAITTELLDIVGGQQGN